MRRLFKCSVAAKRRLPRLIRPIPAYCQRAERQIGRDAAGAERPTEWAAPVFPRGARALSVGRRGNFNTSLSPGRDLFADDVETVLGL